jgi:CO/xanthine dehydrogenase FAD-binding subunit
MIQEYHRPLTMSTALQLLSKHGYKPMGGGVGLSRTSEPISVVDLQSLGLDTIKADHQLVAIGATSKLAALNAGHGLSDRLLDAIKIEYSMNQRNAATWGGLLMRSGGSSLLLAMLLAMDCLVMWQPDSKEVRLGDWLPLRASQNPGKIITQIIIPVEVKIQFEYIARSPRDRVELCCVVCNWKTGRKRLCIGGPIEAPILLVDGSGKINPSSVSQNAYSLFRSINTYQKSAINTIITRLITGEQFKW